MISRAASVAYVWVWLPRETIPTVAGRLESDAGRLIFNYGRRYLERKDAISLYLPELPLRAGKLPLLPGLEMPGCLRDAAPDAWGRRVITNRLLGTKQNAIDLDAVDELTFLLESGSDRVGALDFQRSATDYISREAESATLESLLDSTARLEEGRPLDEVLDRALLHGSSIGGARPKALIEDGDRKYIAKFGSMTDVRNVVKGEFVAMRLADHVGLDVADVELRRALKKDVLLVERFERHRTSAGWTRKLMVSALTLLGLNEMTARYASYVDLAEIVRHRFSNPEATLHELFSRLVFNVLCGNTDDHARNHAAFWDGRTLALTPAYDICPQPRSGGEASQAMLITEGSNLSKLSLCVEAAHHFRLSELDARSEIDRQVTAIREAWDSVAEEAELPETERNSLWGRQFLNPFAFEP